MSQLGTQCFKAFIWLAAPHRLIGILVFIEVAWYILPLWVGMFGVSFSPQAEAYHHSVLVSVSLLVAIVLLFTIVGQQITWYRRISAAPYRDILFRKLGSPLWLTIIVVFSALTLWSVSKASDLRTPFFHLSLCLFAMAWRHEFSEHREQALCNNISRINLLTSPAREYRSFSPEVFALFAVSRWRTSLCAMVLIAGTFSCLFWVASKNLTNAKEATLTMTITTIIGAVAIYSLVMIPSIMIAKRVSSQLRSSCKDNEKA